MASEKYSLGKAGAILGISGVAAAFIFPLMMVALFPFIMWGSWVEMKLWNWFGAPYFHIAPIGFWTTVGISILIGRFTYVDHEQERKTSMTSIMSSITLGPALALGVGYLIHMHISH